MKEFSCRIDCKKCCTGNIVIPVTLGDLYRQWVYTKEIEGESKTIQDVYGERFHEAKIGEGGALLISNMPCPSIDSSKGCKTHGIAQYIVCRMSPESLLLPEYKGSKDIEPYSSANCINDAMLSPEEERRAIMLQNLFRKEIGITRMMMPKEGAEKWVKWMSDLDYEEFKECMWPNIIPTQLDYMEILGIRHPDYTSISTLLGLFGFK